MFLEPLLTTEVTAKENPIAGNGTDRVRAHIFLSFSLYFSTSLSVPAVTCKTGYIIGKEKSAVVLSYLSCSLVIPNEIEPLSLSIVRTTDTP